MITGKARRRPEPRLVLLALTAAASLLLASPALASPVAGDRYEGVYTVPGVPFNPYAPEAPFDPTEAVGRLLGNLKSCREPRGSTPEINFQVNRSGRRAGFFTRFTATDARSGQSINITLEDASPPIEDDLGITRGGMIDPPAEGFALSGTVRLPDGRVTAILPGSALFVGGEFTPIELNQPACRRPRAESVVGFIGALIAVEAPNGELQFFDSDISPFGGYACRVSFCDRAPGPTAQGRSRGSQLRGAASPIRVVKRGARAPRGPGAVAAAADRMGRALTLR